MADRGKRGEDKNTKIWISRERKELFRWNKKHLSKFLKGYDLVKNKNLIKNSRQALNKSFLQYSSSIITFTQKVWNISLMTNYKQIQFTSDTISK